MTNYSTMLLVNEEGNAVLVLVNEQVHFYLDFQSLPIKYGGELQIQFRDGRI